jgi:outer membrane protein assembly complex protein YaeT
MVRFLWPRPMAVKRVGLTLLALSLSSAATDAAVADYVGKTIASVKLTIEDRETTDASLTQVVETPVGQPLSMAAVRESISHLFSLGRFEGVRVDATLAGDRVALVYELSPVHPVTQIQFAGRTNEPGIDESALRRAVTDRYGTTPPLARAADMARIVEDALADRGYRHAVATPRAQVEHDPERATLVFQLEPNARTMIGDIDLVGRPTVPREEFLRRLGLVTGQPFQPARLTAGIERYVADRRAHGYYEARIAPTVIFANEDRIANISVDIRPGPHVRVLFEGDEVPGGRRDELVPIEREGSVDEDLLEDSSNRIEEYFRNDGYRNATAPHSRAEREGDVVITFDVKRGPLYRVATYEITGNTSITNEELAPLLRLKSEQPFLDSRLDADVAAIEGLYRRRGFSAVRARAAFEPLTESATAAVVPVAARIVIAEGVRTTVDRIDVEGSSAIDANDVRGRLGLRVGGPYVPGQVAIDRDAVLQAYQNIGYQNANVDIVPQFSADQTSVALAVRVQEGARIFVDHVLIVGNVRTKTETIERELQIKSGDPYNVTAINESQRRLAALGLFRRVRVTELRHGAETSRDVLITVEEAPVTTIAYGVGAEGNRLAETQPDGTVTERFDIAPRALFEIGRRNLFGKNRSVNLYTSVSRTVVSKLTEYRVVGTFREPRLLDSAADAFLNLTIEQQHRSTFDFSRRSFSASVERRFSGPYRVTGTYQLQRTHVFNLLYGTDDPNFPLIDRAFPDYLLSSFSAAVIRDTRDDALDTHTGNYLSANAQLAAEAIGSEIGLIKSFFTAQMFRTVPRTNRLVFAGSARLGLANGFVGEGNLPAAERFFAGGDTTVRGFALDQLGVRHIPPEPGDTVDINGAAIGGNALVLFNAELRVPVTGGLGVVGFVDTGNVFAHVSTIELSEARTAVGGGIRYKSPIGPLRIDYGVKVKPLPGESRTAWFVSFGQAF